VSSSNIAWSGLSTERNHPLECFVLTCRFFPFDESRSRLTLGGWRKETVKKQWQSKSRNPVSIGDNSQGNGTAGRLPTSQQNWRNFYDTETRDSQRDLCE
jgi:hypothetical protein